MEFNFYITSAIERFVIEHREASIQFVTPRTARSSYHLTFRNVKRHTFLRVPCPYFYPGNVDFIILFTFINTDVDVIFVSQLQKQVK